MAQHFITFMCGVYHGYKHGLKTLWLAVVVARDMIFMFTVVCSPQISIVIVLQQIAYFINALIPM